MTLAKAIFRTLRGCPSSIVEAMFSTTSSMFRTPPAKVLLFDRHHLHFPAAPEDAQGRRRRLSRLDALQESRRRRRCPMGSSTPIITFIADDFETLVAS